MISSGSGNSDDDFEDRASARVLQKSRKLLGELKVSEQVG